LFYQIINNPISAIITTKLKASDKTCYPGSFNACLACFHGVLASEGWWEAWQTSSKVTRSY